MNIPLAAKPMHVTKTTQNRIERICTKTEIKQTFFKTQITVEFDQKIVPEILVRSQVTYVPDFNVSPFGHCSELQGLEGHQEPCQKFHPTHHIRKAPLSTPSRNMAISSVVH